MFKSNCLFSLNCYGNITNVAVIKFMNKAGQVMPANHSNTKHDFLDYHNYSSSHIVQIMDFLEFLHEYCKENSETCTKF